MLNYIRGVMVAGGLMLVGYSSYQLGRMKQKEEDYKLFAREMEHLCDKAELILKVKEKKEES